MNNQQPKSEEVNIECPHCHNETCMCESTPEVDNYMCTSCGYTTNSKLVLDSEYLTNAMKKSPQLVNDLMFADEERKLAWFPSVINIPPKGVLYPEGTLEEWKWVLSQYVELNDEEKSKFNIDGKDTYSHRLDIEHSTKFDNTDFTLALNHFMIMMKQNEISSPT
jgi:hypothetical protein